MTSSNHESEPSVPSKGWILYDGGCGFCFRGVHYWEKVVAGRGFALKDLQSAYSDGSLQISQEGLLDDIRVLTRAGKLESGAKVSIGYFGRAIVGSIEIDTEYLATVRYLNTRQMATKRVDAIADEIRRLHSLSR